MKYFSGVIYTARDAAHQRLVNLVNSGEELPFPIDGAVIITWGRVQLNLVK